MLAHFRFVLRTPFWIATIAILVSTNVAGQPSSHSYKGKLTLAGQELRIGLRVVSGTTLKVLINSESMHLPSTECTGVVKTKGRTKAKLPDDLGALTFRIKGDQLIGEIVLPDGRRKSLMLERHQPKTLVTEPVRFDSETVSLTGAILRPDGPGPFPGIVIASGGGDSAFRDRGYWFWMEYLANRGFAVLGWDKRGCGGSTGSWREVGFDSYAADTTAAATFLSKRAFVARDSVGCLAFSQGGWVSTLAASKSDLFMYIAMVSGPAETVLKADTFATLSAYRAAGITSDQTARGLRNFKLLTDAIRDDSKWQTYETDINVVKDEDWAKKTDTSPTPRDSWFVKWYRQVMDYDPVPAFKKISVPVLWMYGSEDTQLDPVESVSILVRLQRDEKKEFSIYLFPGGGHGLNRPLSADGKLPYAIVPGVLETLDAWLVTRVNLALPERS